MPKEGSTTEENILEKQKLRAVMKEQLRNFSYSAVQAYSAAACRCITEMEAYKKAKVLLCYLAMQGELDPAAVAQDALQNGKRVAYPYCMPGSRTMLALEPKSAQDFERGAYGILSPVRERAVEIVPDEIGMVIVPGLAFDMYGGRLGRGAGYYDRYLSHTQAFRAGICFHMQIVERVPMHAQDCRMDAAVTDAGAHIFGRPAE